MPLLLRRWLDATNEIQALSLRNSEPTMAPHVAYGCTRIASAAPLFRWSRQVCHCTVRSLQRTNQLLRLANVLMNHAIAQQPELGPVGR